MAGIDTRIHVAVGRQDIEAALLAVQVPGLAVAEMVHQGLIVGTGDDADLGDAGVDQVG